MKENEINFKKVLDFMIKWQNENEIRISSWKLTGNYLIFTTYENQTFRTRLEVVLRQMK